MNRHQKYINKETNKLMENMKCKSFYKWRKFVRHEYKWFAE